MIQLRHAVAVATLCCLSATTAPTLHSQDDRDTVQVAPLVVTANRLPTPSSSVSATVTVLDGVELRNQGVHTLLDALRSVPGMTVVQTGSFGSNTSVFLRGGESDYVKVLVDGVAINDPGGSFDFANLTTDNIERIEIVRGPVSVLYGSDAVAGVVQIFTRAGRGGPQAEVAGRAGTYGTLDVSADLHGGIDNVRYAFSVARSTTDGILQFNNDYDNVVWSGKVIATPDERTEAKLSLRYTDSEFHSPTDFRGVPIDQNAFRLQNHLTGSLDVGRFFTNQVEGRLLLALNETDGGLDDRADDVADTVGVFGFTTFEKVSRRSVDARINVHATPANVVTIGAQYEEQKEREFSESLSAVGSSTGSLDVRRENRGYYAQLQGAPVERLALTLGARLDDNETFGTFFTYRAGASYGFVTGTRLRASVGRAFKEPTFFENFADSPFARGNPDLQPERSTTWEIGAEQVLLAGRIRVAGIYFDQRFRDLVQFTFSPPSPMDPNYFNIAAADALGIEVQAHGVVIPELSIGTSYTYLKTEVKDAGFDVGPAAGFVVGERLLRRPTHTFSAIATSRPIARLFLSAQLLYVGDRDDREFLPDFSAVPVVLPAYTRTDVATAIELVEARGRSPSLTATARVENVFNVQYEQVKSFAAPGRTILVGGKLSF